MLTNCETDGSSVCSASGWLILMQPNGSGHTILSSRTAQGERHEFPDVGAYMNFWNEFAAEE